jgi:hypothetical protein
MHLAPGRFQAVGVQHSSRALKPRPQHWQSCIQQADQHAMTSLCSTLLETIRHQVAGSPPEGVVVAKVLPLQQHWGLPGLQGSHQLRHQLIIFLQGRQAGTLLGNYVFL